MSNVIQFVAKKKSEPEHEAKHSWRLGSIGVFIAYFGKGEYSVSISIHAGQHRTVVVRKKGFNLRSVKALAFRAMRDIKLALAVNTGNEDYVHIHYMRLLNGNDSRRMKIEKFTDPVERAQYLNINAKEARKYKRAYESDLETIVAKQ